MARATATAVRGVTRTASGWHASTRAPTPHRAPAPYRAPTPKPAPAPAAILPGAGRAAQRRLRHLQRTVGNRAVAELLAVQRDEPDAGGALDPPVGDPLADPRIAWIHGLDARIKTNIDKLSHHKLQARVSQLTELITTAKARVEATQEGTRDRKRAQRELANLERLQTTVYTRRIAFMDYMECSLGGDAGTRRYWQSLVHLGRGLVVHPQVAIRLARVEKKLAAHDPPIPMPQTTVGQSLRGDHTRNKRERNSPGMLSHAMGLAVDWFAYKNIHQKDPRLRALIEAVTGESSTMQLGRGKSAMYKALGKSPTDDLPKQRAFLNKVESEFTRLSKLSDRLQKLAPNPAIKDWAAEWYAHDAAVAKLKARVRGKRGVARKALQAKLEEAVRAREAKRAELKPKFFAAFAPWRAAVKLGQFDKRMRASKLGWADLESVSTAKGRRWHAQQMKLPRRARAQLRQAYNRARSSRRALHRLAGDVDAAVAAVNGASRLDMIERANLAGELTALSVLAHSGAASARTTLERSSVLLAKGLVRDLPARGRGGGAPDLSSDRRFARWRRRLDRVLGRWRKQISRHQGRVAEAGAKLAQGEQAVPAATREHAEQRRHLLEKDVEIRAKLRAKSRNPKEAARKLARLQDLKREWLLLDQVNTALSKDIGFIISSRSVGAASVVQLLGMTPGTLGGGFFGAPATDKSKAHQNPEGFNKLFFRYMAAEGFDLGAAWSSGDSMHFEFEELQDAIIPPAACEEPPPPRKETARARADYLEEVARRKTLRESRGAFVESAVRSKRDFDKSRP